jgi:glycerophosphoryl diester phosphodiesterase
MTATPLLVALAAAAAALLLPSPIVAAAAEPAGAAAPARRVEIVAHRGESHDAPENTLAAINLTWDRGGEACEMDVHLTADGKLISGCR